MHTSDSQYAVPDVSNVTAAIYGICFIHTCLVAYTYIRRTLRTIFSLARELTITTEQWVYESLSREAWADPLLFPHPRYSSSSSSITVGRRALLQDSMVCVLTYRDPASELLEELVTALGGRHTDDIMDEEIRWVLFGDGDDARAWFQRKRKQKQHLDNVDANQLKTRLKAGEVFTRKVSAFRCMLDTGMDGSLTVQYLVIYFIVDLVSVQLHRGRDAEETS
jgi:hypothetical protein